MIYFPIFLFFYLEQVTCSNSSQIYTCFFLSVKDEKIIR